MIIQNTIDERKRCVVHYEKGDSYSASPADDQTAKIIGKPGPYACFKNQWKPVEPTRKG